MNPISSIRFIGLVVFVCFFVDACTPPPFPLIKQSDGWIQLPSAPPEEKEILSVASDRFKDRYFHAGYVVTWFKKPDIEYLVYTRDPEGAKAFFEEGGSAGCGDVAFEFKKTDGIWKQVGYGLSLVCVD